MKFSFPVFVMKECSRKTSQFTPVLVYKKFKVNKMKDFQCQVKSPWIDFEKTIQVKNHKIKASIKRKIKTSWISPNDFLSIEFDQLRKGLIQCNRPYNVILN